MIAVFVVTKERLEKELRRIGFKPTDIKTDTHIIWKNENGEVLSVNYIYEALPAGYFEELLGAYGVRSTFQGEIVHKQSFNIVKNDHS